MIQEFGKREISQEEFSELEEYIEKHRENFKAIYYRIREILLEDIILLGRSRMVRESKERQQVLRCLSSIKSAFNDNRTDIFFKEIQQFVEKGCKHIKCLSEKEGFTLLFMAYIYDFNDYIEYKCANIRNWLKGNKIESNIYQKLCVFGNQNKIKQELKDVYNILKEKSNELYFIDEEVKDTIIERLKKIVKSRIE